MTYGFVKPGVRRSGLMPYSEVCMYLGVAGKVIEFTLLESGMVQLWEGDRPLSFPITSGEAGVTESGDEFRPLMCRVS